MRHIFFIVCLGFLASCAQDDPSEDKDYIVKSDGSIVYKTEGLELTLLEEGESGNVRNFDGVSFVFKDVSAVNYLERIGQFPSSEDQKSLMNESVFMIEHVGHKPSGSIFENAGMVMDEQEATQYLIGDIEIDFVVVQNNTRYTPEGVQYDGKIGGDQKIRSVFFLKGVDLSQPYTIEYYDRLFGKGLIKLTRKKNDVIS